MNPSVAYKQQQALGWTRIDMLLALYDGAIERLEQACAALNRGDTSSAQSALLRAQRMVMELLAGVDMKYGEVSRRFTQVYEYVLWSISEAAPAQISSSLSVLKTVRDGLEQVRNEVVELERSGQIPPAHAVALSQEV
jgi:flagellin-specific chaperone FliS